MAPRITTVPLDGPLDLQGFRAATRALIAAGIGPDAVRFVVPSHQPLPLFDDTESLPHELLATAPPLPLPAGFVALCETVLMHDEPLRFQRLYAMAHALKTRSTAWQDSLSPQRLELERMAGAVRREMHKTHAFVRFRPVPCDAGVTHVAWFEPAHHIVHAVAPFFVRRFAGMRWALLTPRGCAQWSGADLSFGPAADKSSAPAADDGEALWLAYYRSIFNPARLKLAMMKREMPVRFWANLPEAAQIGVLTASAGERTESMLQAPATPRTRRRSATCDVPASAASANRPNAWCRQG